MARARNWRCWRQRIRDILPASRPIAGNLRQTDLSVPDIHCGACIHTVEKTLGALEGVGSARINLSSKRITIKRRADIETPPDFIETSRSVGYEAHLFEVDSDARDGTLPELIRALAVSGFAAGTLNLTGPLVIKAATAANDSFLAEMLRRMPAAEQRRSAYCRIADRASALYAPVVHLSAALTLLGWMLVEVIGIMPSPLPWPC